jgi:hypothetical protein
MGEQPEMTDSLARRCALPGCVELVQDAPGRPGRKYCSPAHRVAARRLRMAQAHDRPGPEQPALDLPAPRVPEPAAALTSVAEPTSPAVCAAHRPVAALRRGCAAALFGGLGLLAVAGHYLRRRR